MKIKDIYKIAKENSVSSKDVSLPFVVENNKGNRAVAWFGYNVTSMNPDDKSDNLLRINQIGIAVKTDKNKISTLSIKTLNVNLNYDIHKEIETPDADEVELKEYYKVLESYLKNGKETDRQQAQEIRDKLVGSIKSIYNQTIEFIEQGVNIE